MALVSSKLFGVAVAVMLVVYLAKCLGKKAIPIIAGIAIAVVICDQVASHFIKNWVQRYRPCHNPALEGMIRLVVGCGGQYGFVSSHAAIAAGIAAYLTFFMDRRFAWWIKDVSWFLVLIISYSRIYLGVHYPSDVLGGACAGMAVGFLVYQAQRRIRFLKKGAADEKD